MRSKVELFARIRRDARVEGLSIRALARRHGVGRQIVRLALDSAEPPPRKTPVRVARQLQPVKVLIDAMLSEDLQAPRKQRHTIRRIFARLADEHQEAFLEGHIEAFNMIGGIPVRHIRYDNLTSAVTKVLYGGGRQRAENERWVLFRSHYGFDPFYCEPGISGAHEKGGVEGEIGRFRRNFLTPVPVVESLAELNRKIRAWDEGEDRRRIGNRISTVGQDFTAERPFLRPVPVEGFDPGLVLTPRVDRSALISVRTARYSVSSPVHRP